MINISKWIMFSALTFTVISPTCEAPKSQPLIMRADNAVSKGVAYLHSIQEKDGSWSHYPAITALALMALQGNGHTENNDASVARGIAFLLKFQQPNGAIYSSRDPNTALPNYNTALAIMALAMTHNVEYHPIIVRARKFLENLQFGVTDGMKPSNPLYGGIGYGSDPDDHPDLSNLATALEALKASGLPSDAPVFKRAIIFIQRVQNRPESNDQAWVKSGPKDGGFVYDPLGDTKSPKGHHTSTGSMTYSGVESYIICGVSKKDPRLQSAWSWITQNFSVNHNPNQGNAALYYYYNIMAKTLDAYGSKLVYGKHGTPHNWADLLMAKLVTLQHPDGSWYNTNPRYWENQPPLVTAYTLISLSHCIHPKGVAL